MTLETLLYDRIPPPLPDDSIFIGTYTLYDLELKKSGNNTFVLELLSALAELGTVATYDQFLQCFKPSPAESIKAPRVNDPSFETKFSSSSPSKRQILKIANYLKLKQEYDKRNQTNTRLQARSRLVAQNFNADVGGYFLFMCDPAFTSGEADLPKSLPQNERFFFTREHKFELRDEDRQQHTYITAGTGHGKSITIENLIYQDLTRDYVKNPGKQPAIVLLDPHGDLSKTCAKFKINLENDRLVYINPALSETHIPTSNPLDIETNDWALLKNSSEALIDIFAELMDGGDSGKSKFTLQMEAILLPCLTALLSLKNSSLRDLMRFMGDDPEECKDLMHHAMKNLTNPMQLETLSNDFNKDSYNPSKLSIRTKIRSLLNDEHFYHYLVGQSTFNLEEEINKRRFIVFNLSGVGRGTRNIGLFIMAQLIIIAFKRIKTPEHLRIPTFIYVDEFHNFIGPSFQTFVTEVRKYRLYGIFAQQFCGQDMNTKMKRAIIGNSGIKISGRNELASLKTMSAETETPVEDFQNLPRGHFHVKVGNRPSMSVKISKVPQSAMMNEKQWEDTKKRQIEKYYRPIFKEESNTLAGENNKSLERYSRTPKGFK